MLDNIAAKGMASRVVLAGRVITAAVNAANPAIEPEISLFRTHANFSSVIITAQRLARCAKITGIVDKLDICLT